MSIDNQTEYGADNQSRNKKVSV
ncbi:MAG: hypothetical protein FD121_1628, partial [Gallionellaceae bacterium]